MSYQDDLNTSESQRQQDKKANPTQAGHRQADIDHYTRLVTAGRLWGVKNGAARALLNLNAPVPAGSWQKGDFQQGAAPRL